MCKSLSPLLCARATGCGTLDEKEYVYLLECPGGGFVVSMLIVN